MIHAWSEPYLLHHLKRIQSQRLRLASAQLLLQVLLASQQVGHKQRWDSKGSTESTRNYATYEKGNYLNQILVLTAPVIYGFGCGSVEAGFIPQVQVTC